MYMMAKHLHLTAVALSVLLFILRFILLQASPRVLEQKWAKILPHVIDTVLLASALWLCSILSQWPFINDWLTFKVVGLVIYILLGMFALKWGRSAPLRWIGFIGALTWIVLIARVAFTKQAVIF
ncbi:SirB2 family protein [Salinimonas sp. HHU 13199]|uniref:SirB2 family protein n=1 Tax=Salinimonas profundi TaxID=2729140 RepID=A0ABR8LKZ1_9ALTE|nr:SirB2 family protein [Salinimonas profundi]MBD3584967.1 SirB2 family protein [Salinimonas profundi]